MDFIHAITANAIAITVVQPIDVIKTNYQIINTQKKKQQKLKDVIKIINKNGIKGFYSGITPNLLSYPIFWGNFHMTLQHMKRYYDNDTNTYIKLNTNYKYFDDFFQSYVSACVASTITNPFFVIKNRLQTRNNDMNGRKITNIVENIIFESGYKGFNKGLSLTLIENAKLGFQFPIYNNVYSLLNENDNINTGNKFMKSLIASSISKTIVSFFSYPIDIIRENQRYSIKKLSIIDVSKNIYSRLGIFGFYKGITIYLFRTIPNFAITMFLLDYMKNQ